MTKSSITFLRVRGIPIGAHWTWSLVFLLLARILATSYFPQAAPHLPAGAYVALALLTSLLFFTGIVLHELGHAFRALREGMRIEGITLWLFGGVARFAGMFPSPGAELRVAVAGPAVSLVIALVMWGAAAAAHALGLPPAVEAVAGYLARINGILVAFNLVPALPLDGGRVLRAVLWHRQRSFTAATISASRAGRAFAFVLIGTGLAGLLTEAGTDGIMFAFLGWFLLQAAGAETQYALMLRALGPLSVGDLTLPDPLIVTPDTTIARFLQAVSEAVGTGRRHEAYAVAADGRLDGLVSLRRAAGVAREARDRTTVSDVMLPREQVTTLERTVPALDALPALLEGAPAAVVTPGAGSDEGERIDGALTFADVARGVEREHERAARTDPPARRAGWAIWTAVVVAMTVCVASVYHPPYVVVSPGPAIDISHDVRISGVQVHPIDGRYLLVSVRLTSPSALGLGLAAIRPDREIIPMTSVGNQPGNQVEVFRQSRQLAAAAAARAAGLDVRTSGTGAQVVQAVRGTPAYGVLRRGDVIVAIDGRPVQQDADVRAAIRARKQGTTFRITVERGSRTLTIPVRSAAVPQSGQGVAAIGVYLQTRDFDIHLPFQAEFRERTDIGGPSAGLAYALVIADLLGPDDLGHNRTIAATGTIDVQGVVGEIGGIREKARGARDKQATVFVVPAAEATDVAVPGLAVHGVATLDQALTVLRQPS
ncbi:MAG TPA: site-2 protease family protein [Actinomycetota bacterium]|jgi:PDZ domain-containing secreted protein/Zn-dependent protease